MIFQYLAFGIYGKRERRERRGSGRRRRKQNLKRKKKKKNGLAKKVKFRRGRVNRYT